MLRSALLSIAVMAGSICPVAARCTQKAQHKLSIKRPAPDRLSELEKPEAWLNFLPWVFAVTPRTPEQPHQYFWEVRLLGLQFKPGLKFDRNTWTLHPAKQPGPLKSLSIKLWHTTQKDKLCLYLNSSVQVSPALPLDLRQQLKKDLNKAWGEELLPSLKAFLQTP